MPPHSLSSLYLSEAFRQNTSTPYALALTLPLPRPLPLMSIVQPDASGSTSISRRAGSLTGGPAPSTTTTRTVSVPSATVPPSQARLAERSAAPRHNRALSSRHNTKGRGERGVIRARSPDCCLATRLRRRYLSRGAAQADAVRQLFGPLRRGHASPHISLAVQHTSVREPTEVLRACRSPP